MLNDKSFPVKRGTLRRHDFKAAPFCQMPHTRDKDGCWGSIAKAASKFNPPPPFGVGFFFSILLQFSGYNVFCSFRLVGNFLNFFCATGISGYIPRIWIESRLNPD